MDADRSFAKRREDMMTAIGVEDGKLFCNELAAPGYVWFRCADYPGLPDNTTHQTGYFGVYRPLGDVKFNGHEHVTAEMRADAEALHAHMVALEQKAIADTGARVQRAWDIKMAIPDGAVAELRMVNRTLRRKFSDTGEGPFVKHEWDSAIGVEILKRWCVDAGAVASAEDILARDDIH